MSGFWNAHSLPVNLVRMNISNLFHPFAVINSGEDMLPIVPSSQSDRRIESCVPWRCQKIAKCCGYPRHIYIVPRIYLQPAFDNKESQKIPTAPLHPLSRDAIVGDQRYRSNKNSPKWNSRNRDSVLAYHIDLLRKIAMSARSEKQLGLVERPVRGAI